MSYQATLLDEDEDTYLCRNIAGVKCCILTSEEAMED